MAEFEEKRVFNLPGGGTVKVTVRQSEPINIANFGMLRPQAAIEMAKWLVDLAEAFKPKGDLNV